MKHSQTQAKSDLSERETLLAAAQEVAGAGIFVWDIKSDSLLCSRNMFELFGVSESEFPRTLSEVIKIFIHREDRCDVEYRLKQMIERGEAGPLQFRMVRPDRREQLLRWLGKLKLDENNRPAKCTGVICQVTDSASAPAAAAEELRRSEERFRLLIENMADPVYVHRVNEPFLMVNKAASRLIGYGVEELLTMKVPDIDPGSVERGDEERVWRTLNHGETARFPVVHRRKDGSTYTAEAHLNCFYIGGEPLIVAIIRDMTDHERARQDLLAYQERLKSLTLQAFRIEESERRRIACVLHDSVCQFLATCLLKTGALGKETLSESARQTLNDISDILRQTIPITRSLLFEISPPVLYELGVAAAVESLAQIYSDQYDLRCLLDAEAWIEPDDQEKKIFLYQAVRELLLNVRKHAQATTIEITLEARPEGLLITVRDDGQGFDYAGFRSSPKTTCDRFGLFALQERVKYFGGLLLIDSSPGSGTAVRLQFSDKAKAQKPQREEVGL